VDIIGIGSGPFDRLAELGLPVRPCNVGETPSAKDQFLRKRDELWHEARDWFETRTVSIPEDEALIDELSMVRYGFESSGKRKVESKKEMRQRGQRSPDLADAFVMTFMNTKTTQGNTWQEMPYDGRWII
jgi:hypothetical protein